jgi:hypothetical protein
MGKTHSKPLAGRHGRGTAWERHATWFFGEELKLHIILLFGTGWRC